MPACMCIQIAHSWGAMSTNTGKHGLWNSHNPRSESHTHTERLRRWSPACCGRNPITPEEHLRRPPHTHPPTHLL
jgi:hypothetical protein